MTHTNWRALILTLAAAFAVLVLTCFLALPSVSAREGIGRPGPGIRDDTLGRAAHG